MFYFLFLGIVFQSRILKLFYSLTRLVTLEHARPRRDAKGKGCKKNHKETKRLCDKISAN